MIEVCTLASGSKGNCVLIKNEKTKILIDIGISLRQLENLLILNHTTATEIDACLITHEHIDHIKGITRFCDKYDKPIHTHNYCANVLKKKKDLKAKYQSEFSLDSFKIGDLTIEPFEVSHDSVYACGYRICDTTSSIVYATDMGYCSDRFLDMAKESDMVIIESNHDVEMLKCGHYPAHVKRRILSNYGHLSNVACASAIEKLIEGRPRKFILAHISEENNLYELAQSATKQNLKQKGVDMDKEKIKVHVASQYESSGFLRSKDD